MRPGGASGPAPAFFCAQAGTGAGSAEYLSEQPRPCPSIGGRREDAAGRDGEAHGEFETVEPLGPDGGAFAAVGAAVAAGRAAVHVPGRGADAARAAGLGGREGRAGLLRGAGGGGGVHGLAAGACVRAGGGAGAAARQRLGAGVDGPRRAVCARGAGRGAGAAVQRRRRAAAGHGLCRRRSGRRALERADRAHAPDAADGYAAVVDVRGRAAGPARGHGGRRGPERGAAPDGCGPRGAVALAVAVPGCEPAPDAARAVGVGLDRGRAAGHAAAALCGAPARRGGRLCAAARADASARGAGRAVRHGGRAAGAEPAGCAVAVARDVRRVGRGGGGGGPAGPGGHRPSRARARHAPRGPRAAGGRRVCAGQAAEPGSALAGLGLLDELLGLRGQKKIKFPPQGGDDGEDDLDP